MDTKSEQMREEMDRHRNRGETERGGDERKGNWERDTETQKRERESR